MQMWRAASQQLVQRHYELVYQPLTDAGGQSSGIAVVCVDVSELMAARDAAESASRAKDEFIAVLGHELRNPLAPIATALQLMKIRSGDVAVNERAIIDRQVQHMTRLIDDLLDVSRIARGTVALRLQLLELSAIMDKAVETAEPLFEKKQQLLTVDLPRQGLIVNGDPTRLSQIVSNLLINASKFTDSKGNVSISTAVEGNEVVIVVSDSGVGMTANELERIFEMFVQGHQDAHRPVGGLGLGLTIARNLARLHGGTLSATSDGPGSGSRFTLRLPLADAAATSTQPAANEISSKRPAKGRRVLLVEDIEEIASAMRDLLRELGYEVLLAQDGPSALKLLSSESPIDVALLDIGLPVMDGYELAGHLRSSLSGRALRIIALSGYGQMSDKKKSSGVGFDAHLVKPVAIDDLIQAMEGQ
jgi:signal transduction histidine kinase/CheY-like chemotaxis protein